MKFERIHSDIGFDAISLLITLEHDKTYQLDELEDYLIDIQSHETISLIITGAIIQNETFLSWLTARLIAEAYNVVIKVSLTDYYESDSMIEFFAQRVILEITTLFPKWTEVLNTLNEGDSLYFRMDSLSALEAVKRALDTRQKFDKVHIFVDSDKIDPKHLLKGNNNSRIWVTNGDA